MFSANSGRGLNHYRNVGVDTLATTAAPHQLVLMLFDGARAAIAQAKGQIERREIEAKGKSISQAISIIDGGLKASLDLKVGGELAQNLSDLYVYMGQRLFHANLKNDSAALDEVATLLEQLGEAWRSIAAKQAPAAGAAPVRKPPQTYSAPVGSAQTHRAAAEPTYGVPIASAQTREATAAPVQATAPQNRAALAAAKAYGAAPAGPTQSISPVPAVPAAAAPSTAPNHASPQSRRLAAAYGSL